MTVTLPAYVTGNIEIGENDVVIAPQPGPQTAFLCSKSDITIYGGAAGGGKTRGTLMFAAKHAAIKPVPNFRAVIFRRTYNLITQAGGIWDESQDIYSYLGGKPTRLKWEWKQHKTSITFAHMQHHPKDTYAKKGMQAELFCFEELTEFEEAQFFYMVSRNRSRCGVQAQTIATTNPEYDSWVRVLLTPWVDDEYDGPGGAAKSGETRWFVREENEESTIRWLAPGETHPNAISLTFIVAFLSDNPALLKNDPDYARRLEALPLTEKLKLKYGDWFARKRGGKIYPRDAWQQVTTIPKDIIAMVRRWDLASTEDPRKEVKDKMRGGPDFTAGVLVGKTRRGTFIVLHAVWDRQNEQGVYKLMQQIAERDGQSVSIRMEQEPGGSGKRDVSYIRREILPDYDFLGIPSEGNKVERSRIPASHVQGHNVELLIGPWTEGFLDWMESFPNSRVHDDIPDAFNGAIKDLLDMSGDGGILTLDEVNSSDSGNDYSPFW